MTVLELFKDHPERWIKHALATQGSESTELYHRVNPLDPSARCWCLGGAIMHCYVDHVAQAIAFGKAMDLLPQGWATIAKFNDRPETTFEDIMSIVKRAGI